MPLRLGAAKDQSVRSHLEGETPKNESSEAKRPRAWFESSRGRIVEGAKRLGGETSRQGAKRLHRLQAQVQVLTHKDEHKSKYSNSKSKSKFKH